MHSDSLQGEGHPLKSALIPEHYTAGLALSQAPEHRATNRINQRLKTQVSKLSSEVASLSHERDVLLGQVLAGPRGADELPNLLKKLQIAAHHGMPSLLPYFRAWYDQAITQVNCFEMVKRTLSAQENKRVQIWRPCLKECKILDKPTTSAFRGDMSPMNIMWVVERAPQIGTGGNLSLMPDRCTQMRLSGRKGCKMFQ